MFLTFLTFSIFKTYWNFIFQAHQLFKCHTYCHVTVMYHLSWNKAQLYCNICSTHLFLQLTSFHWPMQSKTVVEHRLPVGIGCWNFVSIILLISLTNWEGALVFSLNFIFYHVSVNHTTLHVHEKWFADLDLGISQIHIILE